MKLNALNTARVILAWGLVNTAYGSLDVYPLIELDRIAMIESSGNPRAYNSKEGAYGLFQIRQQALQAFNDHQGYKYHLSDMYDPAKARQVADWYFHYEIPRLLRAYRHEVTLSNMIIAYNAGIGNVGKPINETTRRYLKKYLLNG